MKLYGAKWTKQLQNNQRNIEKRACLTKLTKSSKSPLLLLTKINYAET